MCLSVLVHKLAYKEKNHYKAVFLFLHYTLRMRMVINGSMQHVFSGEGTRLRLVESRMLYVGAKESMPNVSRSGEKGGPFALANGGK